MVRIEPEGQMDCTIVFMQNSLYHRCVTFIHLACGEGEGESTMRLGGHGKNHQSGGVHIQPMDSRLGHHGGEKAAKPRCGTVLLVRTTTGNGQQSSRFIDDDDCLIAENNFHIG